MKLCRFWITANAEGRVRIWSSGLNTKTMGMHGNRNGTLLTIPLNLLIRLTIRTFHVESFQLQRGLGRLQIWRGSDQWFWFFSFTEGDNMLLSRFCSIYVHPWNISGLRKQNWLVKMVHLGRSVNEELLPPTVSKQLQTSQPKGISTSVPNKCLRDAFSLARYEK